MEYSFRKMSESVKIVSKQEKFDIPRSNSWLLAAVQSKS